MKKFISALMAIILCLSLCACDNNNEEVTEQTTAAFVNTLPELEPNLQRLQGCWAASENYEEADPSFLCAMPATWDENMKGYYVIVISENTLVYRWFHPSGYNGTPGGHYSSYLSEKEYEIERVTETSSDEYQTEFLLDLIINDVAKQVSITLYDNTEIYKNSFMRNSFEDFMFVKLNDEQKEQLMNTMSSIISENKDGEKISPYVGMPKSKLEKSSWGKPYDINITEVEDHVFEQWCYSNGRYVYVDDGYVSAIQK